jgi:subtilase family serine protease
VVVDSFGSPTIAADLHTFDTTYGLPDPPSLKVIQPAGPVPAFDPSNSDMWNWAFETTLDVEYAHAIAPGAKILLVETPVAETEGVTGFPEIVKAENYVIDHHLGDVITQSFGATEQTFPSAASIYALRSAFINARRHDVTVLGSSGDSGATDYELDGSTLYPFAVNSWPSSDPLVTSVGGTQLTLDGAGNRLTPDVVWNDGYGAGGGGVSSVFSRPDFQDRVRSVVGHSRGTPDISMSAAVDGGVVVYLSFDAPNAGWYIVGGTSEASPLFSGIVAIADQAAHHRLGWINPALYSRTVSRSSGVVDVTSGDISFAGVTGPSAGPGYDLASGWGTVDAPAFVRALVRASD